MMFLIALLAQCCSEGKPLPWAGYNKAITWETSLADAQKKAKAENKLLMYFVLVGELDKEGC